MARMGRWTPAAAVAAAAVALAAAPARADTIVFQRNGDVWLTEPDGSGQRAVTHGERKYQWPSEADDGTVVALGADDAGGLLYRLTQRGTQIGAPIPTPSMETTPQLSTEPPTHVRVSPNGERIAFDQVIDDDVTTFWTPSSATALTLPNQDRGQEELASPAWIGNDRLLLSADAIALAPGEPAFRLYAVGGPDDSATGWFSDAASTWATGFDATISRSGTRIAVLEDDAAENVGVPTRLAIRLFTASAPGTQPQFRCEIALAPDENYQHTSPTFSPDGTGLAWAEADGIHVAGLGGLGDCGAIRERVIVAAGALEPYWGPADDRAPGAGGGGSAGGLKLRVRVRRHRSLADLLAHGVAARVSCSAPCSLRVRLRVDAATARRAGLGRRIRTVGRASRRLARAGTVTVRVRLGARAARALGSLAGFGLRLRVSAPGAKSATARLRVG